MPQLHPIPHRLALTLILAALALPGTALAQGVLVDPQGSTSLQLDLSPEPAAVPPVGSSPAPGVLSPHGGENLSKTPVGTRENMTGGQGISLDGRSADQRLMSLEDQGARDTRLGLGTDSTPHILGDSLPGQREAVSSLEHARTDHAVQTEFTPLADFVLQRTAASAPDRVPVRWKGKGYIFRPYYVLSGDTEMPPTLRTRKLARDFRLTEDEALAAFTQGTQESFLWIRENGPLTIQTRWEKVDQLAESPDYYAFITVGDTDLAAHLVQQGWARAEGRRVPGPAGEPVTELMGSLRAMEQTARTEKVGAWGWKKVGNGNAEVERQKVGNGNAEVGMRKSE